MEITINERFFAEFLERYNELNDEGVSLWERQERASKNGDVEATKRFSNNVAINHAKMAGMFDTLGMLGYTVKSRNGELVIAKARTLKPFKVNVQEVFERTVVVWAEDGIDAVEIAEELCNDSAIDLNAEDFKARECTHCGIVEEQDLGCYEQHGNPEG